MSQPQSSIALKRQRSSKVTGWKVLSSKYVFEFFIVFFGVYLAFVFTDYQEALRDKKIRIKYYDSLIFEFEGFYKHLQTEASKLDLAMLIVDGIESGQQPQLETMDFYYLYNGIAVRTAFNGNNFAAIDEQLLKSIIGGIYQLEVLENKIQRFTEYQQQLLLPMLVQGQPLYTSEGQLVDHLSWYPLLIKEIEYTNKLRQSTVKAKAIPYMQNERAVLENLPFWRLEL